MDPLKKLFFEKASAQFNEIRPQIKANGDKIVDQVKLSQLYGGMRGVKSIVWDPSELDAVEGIRFRGYSIPELQNILPTAEGGNEPLPEGIFWLMLTGEVPTKEQVQWLTDEWEKRSDVPAHTIAVLDALPDTTHPMSMFSIAVNSMETESVFSKNYAEGMNKSDYWDATYEDTMNLIAKLPKVAAYIYRKAFHNNEHIKEDNSLDWAANFAHMLGHDSKDFKELMRLYLTIHADHEGGNASAHTVHLTGSTLSSAYLSLSSGLNSLAGPLHGLANQEVIKWIFGMVESLGTSTPSDEQVTQYINDTLAAGKVIPGYGHAVLRQPDPRFTAQRVFAEKNIEGDEYVNIVWQLFRIVPDILGSLGKVKNPWPNVDAHSGALLVHYGLKEYTYYTVLFGVSRALGVLAGLCWSRAMGFALERPKSVTTEWLKTFLKENA